MRIPSLTRREFLQSTAAASSGAAIAHIAPSLLLGEAASPKGTELAPAWATKPMRWMQLHLVEDDPAHFDPGFWLNYFKRTRTDAVCLSGGGCVAYYPTEIPFHHRSAWLGGRDVLGQLIAGCRGMGMTVLVRTDPHATYDDAATAHPDWIAVDAEGKAATALGIAGDVGHMRVWPLQLRFHDGGAQRDHVALSRRRDFSESLGWERGLLLRALRGELQRGYGTGTASRDVVQRSNAARVVLVAAATADEPARCMERDDAEINPEASMIPNNGSGALNSLDAMETSRRAPLLVADRQARHGLAAPWLMGKTAKEFRATLGDKPAVGLFGVGLEEPYRWKDSVTQQRGDSHMGFGCNCEWDAAVV